MNEDKQLIKETLMELKAAKERVIRGGGKCPIELDQRIKMYSGGFVRQPRNFDSELRHIITASILEDNDFRYDSAIGKFVNGKNDIAASMKEAVAVNDENDKKRRELGYKIPEYRKKDRQVVVNITLGRPPEFVETPPEPKPFTSRPEVIDQRSVNEIIKERIQNKNNTTGLAALVGKKII